jgi:hypothetical protein
VADDGEICEGLTFQLIASGGITYRWFTEDFDLMSTSPSLVVQPESSTSYHVTVIDANNCDRIDTVNVDVVDSVDVEWQYRLNGNCNGLPSVSVQNVSPPADDVAFYFDFGDGTISNEPELEHIYQNDGLYWLTFVAEKRICSFEDAVQIPIYNLLAPNIFTPEITPGHNDNFEIRFGSDMISPADAGMPVQLVVHDRWGKTVFESSDYNNDWSAQGLASGVYYYQVRVGELVTCKTWLHIMK